MLLAVDTSTRIIGIAVYDGVRVLSEASWTSNHHHTVELGPAVADTLARVGVKSQAIQAVGVAIGPGSFTGLRIGLAFAKGLAFSGQAKLVGIPTLDIVAAAQVLTDRILAVVLEAGRRRIAAGWYRVEDGSWVSRHAPENLSVEDFVSRLEAKTTICGEVNDDLRHRLIEISGDIRIESPARSVRRPAVLAELAWARWLAGRCDDPETLKPIYLHQGEPIPA